VDDEAALHAETYTLQVLHPPVTPAGVLSRTLASAITYGSGVQLTLNAGAHGNALTVMGVLTGTTASINAGTGNDKIVVGNASHNLDDLGGALTVAGQAGTNQLLVDDAQATGANTPYSLTATTVGRSGIPAMTYGQINALTLSVGSGPSATVSVAPSAAATFMLIGNHSQFQAGHGDVLNLDQTGVTNALLTITSPGAGQWTFSNRQTVTFVDMAANVTAGPTTPTVEVTATSGPYTGQPVAVNPTVTGSSGIPGTTLENVGLLCRQHRLHRGEQPARLVHDQCGHAQCDAADRRREYHLRHRPGQLAVERHRRRRHDYRQRPTRRGCGQLRLFTQRGW
jgi:hypothetical protein